MGKFMKWVWFSILAMFTAAAMAQEPQQHARVVFSQPELDQMLAPIALYPDPLLSQVLMAATYPRDLAEAASWSQANGRPRGDEAVRAAEREPWDPSVISLVAFPDLLYMMDERRDWTQRLGDAFLAQPDDVMNAVQHLRRRADEAGHLRSGEEMVVQRNGDDYVIEPPSPEVVYVPYYDPRVVYGDWWWPNYAPVYWGPWTGYRWHAGYGGLGWGYGIHLGPSFFFSTFDWGHRYVRYSHHRPWYHRGHHWRGGHRWTHNGDRDGRWRDGNRDGRSRDGNRDGRWRDRDGRTADNRPRLEQRGDVTLGRAGSVAAPAAPVTQQGVFPAQAQPAPRSTTVNPVTRSATPRYGIESPRYERRREANVHEGAARVAPREAQAPRTNAVRTPIERTAPVERAAPVQRAPIERAAPAPRVAPVERAVPAPRVAPVERAAAVQRAAPVERAAPVQRAAPAERSAPAARESAERSAPSRGSENSGASRGSPRGRDR